MVILIDTEKAAGELHHVFQIKRFNKLRIENISLNSIKGIQENPIANIILNNECFPLKIRKIISLTKAFRRIKYKGINLTNEVKDLNTESCKTLIKRN